MALKRYRLIAELDAANDVKKLFVYASKAHVPDYYTDGTNDFMLITDHLGTVRLVVKVSDGTIVQRTDYNDLGGITYSTGASAQPLRYAGGIYDSSTGFVHFGHRDYDPETGRWLTKDPILFGGGDPNLYGYVMADPINLVDPKGLFGIEVGIGGSGSFVTGVAGSYNFAITFNPSNGNIQWGTTTTLQGSYGPGAYLGGGLNISVTPGANSICELGGAYAGAGGSAGVGFVGGGGQITAGGAGPTLTVSPIGYGGGAQIYGTVGETFPRLGGSFNLYNAFSF